MAEGDATVMNNFKDRLKEPTSYLGLASIFQGIGECMQGNYESGLPLVFLGLVGILIRCHEVVEELSKKLAVLADRV